MAQGIATLTYNTRPRIITYQPPTQLTSEEKVLWWNPARASLYLPGNSPNHRNSSLRDLPSIPHDTR